MKPISFLLGTLLSLLTAHAEPPDNPGDSPPAVLTLSAVTERVLAHNAGLKEIRARWRAMKERPAQAGAWDDVKLNGSTRLARFVDIARNGFADQMLSVEQMIPLSGRNRSRERIAAAEALASWEDVRRKELEVVARARVAFYGLARDYALLELNRANQSSLVQTVEISRARLEVGHEGQADVLVAQNEVNRLEESGHDLLRNISEDETQLKVLMHLDPFSRLGKPAPASSTEPVHFPVEELRALLLNNRPEIRGAEAGVAAAKAKLELARREWIPDPTVSLEAQRYNGAAQGVSELDAGISFNLPWLNAKKYRAEEREAAHGLEAAQEALDEARIAALGLLRDQLEKIETFHHHVELFAGRLIPNARETVQTNRANYESGKTGFLDLILSERNLRELESMQRAHLAEYEIGVAELEAVVGADLHRFCAPRENPKRRAP